MPQVALPRKAIEKYSRIENPEDVKKALFEQIPVDDIEVSLNRILCATYIGYERFKSGLFKPVESIAEDVWQGKAALVLKVGGLAFKDSGEVTFNGFSVQPGDWITFKVGNASLVEICDYPCRMTLDHYVESRIPDPRMITS